MSMDAYRTPPRRDRSRLRTLHRAGRLAALGLGIGFGAGLASLALELTLLRAPSTPDSSLVDAIARERAQMATQAAAPAPTPDPPAAAPEAPRMTPEQTRATLAREAEAVIKALRGRDTRALAAMIDPDVGLELGPSGELGHERQALSPREVEGCFHDRRARIWGDGVGEDITLTCAAYWEQYVYDRDFAASANIAYNEHPDFLHSFSRSFSPQPDEAFVEYYLTADRDGASRGGAEAESGAHRASALILVFSPIGRTWKLTGITHAEEPPASEGE